MILMVLEHSVIEYSKDSLCGKKFGFKSLWWTPLKIKSRFTISVTFCVKLRWSLHSWCSSSNEADSNGLVVPAADKNGDKLSDNEPKVPPGFSFSGNHQENKSAELQLPLRAMDKRKESSFRPLIQRHETAACVPGTLEKSLRIKARYFGRAFARL